MAKKTETNSAKKGAAPKAKAKGAGAKTQVAGPPRQPGVERRQLHPMRAKHGYFQIVLTHAVPHLGKAGDLVKVRAGYARNYLLPQGLATFALPHTLRIVEQHRKRLEMAEAARLAELRNIAAQLSQRKYLIEANANAEGHLYGSVNADQIAAALRQDNFAIDVEHIRLDGQLKDLGQYSIRVRLAPEIETDVELWVVPTHTDEA